MIFGSQMLYFKIEGKIKEVLDSNAIKMATQRRDPLKLVKEFVKEHNERLAFFKNHFYICEKPYNIWKCCETTFEFIKTACFLEKATNREVQIFIRELSIILQNKYPKIFEPNKHILSMKGAYVFDIIEGIVRKRTPEDLCTSSIPAKYDSDADTGPFIKFLDEVLEKHAREFIEYIVSLLQGGKPTIGFMLTNNSSGISSLIQCITKSFGNTFSILGDIYNKSFFEKYVSGTFGSFINIDTLLSRDGQVNVDRFIFNTEIEGWSPIYVGSKEELCESISFFEKFKNRKFKIFSFNNSFVMNPNKPNEKKRDIYITKKLLENKEGIIKVFVDALQKTY